MKSIVAIALLAGCAAHEARHTTHARADGLLAAFVELAVDAAFSSSSGGEASDPGEQLPDRIDHDMAAFALGDALPALRQCAIATPIPLTITVRPNGELESAQVQAPPASQQCVTEALGGLDFPRTVHGGRFRWSLAAATTPPDGSATASN